MTWISNRLRIEIKLGDKLLFTSKNKSIILAAMNYIENDNGARRLRVDEYLEKRYKRQILIAGNK